MLPVPTKSAVILFLGLSVLLGVGIVLASPFAVGLAGVGFLGLALALAAAMPLGRRVRRQRLEFAWWLGHGSAGGVVVPGAPFDVRCYVRCRSDRALWLEEVILILPPDGVRLLSSQHSALVLGPRARTEFGFRLVAPAVGRVVLQGLAVSLRGPLGLFRVPLYFPNPLALKVLPRAAAPIRPFARTITGQPVERSGRTVLRRRGGGTELYELREFQSGDPFKSIAWKASARRGKLLVKEVEREVQETRFLIVDVSGTMRGGAPGERKLDFAIEAAATEARRSIDDGDRVGLITVDGRLLSQVPARDGAPHLLRMLDALLAATEIVDADITDITEQELVRLVARYVRHQDGVEFSSREDASRIDVSALVRHVGRILGEVSFDQIQAPNPASATLRYFCRIRGIALPHRPDPRDGVKGPGLAEALRAAGGQSRSPMSIVVLTDFDGAEVGALVSAVKLVRAHGHRVAFVAPDARAFASSPESDLDADLRVVYGMGEERRLLEAKRVLGRLGVPVVVTSTRSDSMTVLSRAHHSRRVA